MAETEKPVQKYKLDAVERLQTAIGQGPNVIFSDFRGLTVAQITDLRDRLREAETVYRVVRNSSARFAFEALQYEGVAEFLNGPTALALTKEEYPETAKILVQFARDASLTIKGAYVDGRRFKGDEVQNLSLIPGRQQLYAMLLGTMQGPVRNLMYTLQGVIQKVLWVLAEVEETKRNES